MSPEEIHWDYPQPYTLGMTVAREDIDGLEHTNNTVYVNQNRAFSEQKQQLPSTLSQMNSNNKQSFL